MPEDSDELFGEVESLVPIVSSVLSQAGLATAMEAGMTVLFAVDRPADPRDDLALRRRVLRCVVELSHRLEQRAGGDRRVRADFCVHVTSALVQPAGTPVDGDLMDFSSWVPETASAGGVLVSRAALDGLSAAADSSLANGDIEFVSLAPGAMIALA